MFPGACFIGVKRAVAVPGVELLERRGAGNTDGGPTRELSAVVILEVAVIQSYFRPKFEGRSENRQERTGGR
jgi:hypothetical protein